MPSQRIIDLRSDTVTRPTPSMREAMASAPVGDDVYGEDPTVNALEKCGAGMLGKAAALFVPSGTMANQIAIRAQTERGDALIAGEGCHINLYEAGGAAALSGVHSILIGNAGLFTRDEVLASLLPEDVHFPTTRLVCLENTHNRSGGRLFPQRDILDIAELAAERDLRLHLDGARIFNAAIASGVAAAELSAPFDSVSFCLSKGLGAPVGSLLCGGVELIAKARRLRKLFGGGMRQAGILAAAGLHALEHHVERLGEDHRNATRLAAQIRKIPCLERIAEPETNMILLKNQRAAEIAARLREEGVLIGLMDPTTLRAVTHMDVSDADLERVSGALGRVLDEPLGDRG